MAQFKQWALEYVLSDDDTTQGALAKKAAKEIETSRASSTVVGNWAASVQRWMTAAPGDDDRMDDGDDGSSGDIIARAKALGFLAATLEALDKNTLRSDQVLRLLGFFGAMFSYDHKAGITASAKALRQLCSMKGFKPDMGIKVLEDVCKIKEDFRLQMATTRLELYELFHSLVRDPAVASELKQKHGAACGFAVDLLQLCHSERDPRNLMVWFKTLALLVSDFDPSPEVTEEIFKTFSAYFPISLRSSATPIGITAEDLKEAVRACFSAHQRLAKHAFPFLLQKLDQGDAVSVPVKVDILKTIKACIDKYENPQTSLIPHTNKIWNSLKYEVRNGEVKETIDATLEVLRAIARKYEGPRANLAAFSALQEYIDLVFRDCRDDLANPTYTKQAGLLLMTVVTANIRAYLLYNASFVEAIRENLRQPKSPAHTRDLLLLINSLLKTRMELFRARHEAHPDDEEGLRGEAPEHLQSLFYDVYLAAWAVKAKKELASEDKDILKHVIQGLGILVSQQVLQSDGTPALLCSGAVCSEICFLLGTDIIRPLTLSPREADAANTALEDEAVQSLRTIVSSYRNGYVELARRVKAETTKRGWDSPSEYTLRALRDLLSRFTYIGASQIPSDIAADAPSEVPYSPLQHFVTLTSTLLEMLPLSSRWPDVEGGSANSHLISSLHASVIWFRDACSEKYRNVSLAEHADASANWLQEFASLPEDKPPSMGELLQEDDPETYTFFLKLGLLTLRRLYRQASSTGASWDERSLVQLSQMATLVVSQLGLGLQTSCNLVHEAFNYFHPAGQAPASQALPSLARSLLTLGILQGLRPPALAGLYQPGGQAEQLMCDTSALGTAPTRESDVRAAIGLILANKVPSSSDPAVMQRVFDFWNKWWNDATANASSSTLDPATFSFHNKLGMHVLAGAAYRQDSRVLALLPTIRQAISSGPHPVARAVAASVSLLVRLNDILTRANHAVVKALHRQWVYAHLAKPLLQDAQPTGGSGDTAATARCRAAALSIASHCPFAFYQDDLALLVRLIVLNLSAAGRADSEAAGEEDAWEQALAALGILDSILHHEPDALKGYLREVIRGATGAYQACLLPASSSSAGGLPEGERSWPTRAKCRLYALRVLKVIAERIEDRLLVAYAPPTNRMLAVACGDPTRKVRLEAMAARDRWLKFAD
ncbi:hypothetical protein VTJ83DRAFT_1959 [Remersonia thermophila]|uniref:MMS19 nucleotide excision repair protein n=1 Tax=Remersonia thermophila TaxID=72144 RepID=A0ABR4DHZ0_9PEZI